MADKRFGCRSNLRRGNVSKNKSVCGISRRWWWGFLLKSQLNTNISKEPWFIARLICFHIDNRYLTMLLTNGPIKKSHHHPPPPAQNKKNNKTQNNKQSMRAFTHFTLAQNVHPSWIMFLSACSVTTSEPPYCPINYSLMKGPPEALIKHTVIINKVM